LARPLAHLREGLLDLLAHLEAGLDFVEEDIEFISRDDLLDQLQGAMQQVASLAAQMQSRGDAAEQPRVALYGLPNTGKSSLFNALAEQDAAIVTSVAGTTRDFVTREVRFGQQVCLLIDTAGITEALSSDSLDQAMQAATGRQSQTADWKLLCLDMTREVTAWEAAELSRPDDRRIVVGTKSDLHPIRRCSFPVGIATSSRTGQGIGELAGTLAAVLQGMGIESGAIAATADRCRESLRLAAEELRRGLTAATAGSGEELVAASVRLALEEMGSVSGAIYTEDILDRVFSRFCIGK
jgi:tRNA modification GTPase